MDVGSTLSDRIRFAASGQAPLVFKNANVLNVYTHEWLLCDVAVVASTIVGVGTYTGDVEIDVAGKHLVPGLIDAHVHIESSQVTPRRYAEAVLPRGVTSVITDPHEIANVLGTEGIRFMLDASEGLPLTVYVMLPSCVPATPLEEAGAALSADDLAPFLTHPRVLGLAEMMDVPGVLSQDPAVLAKLQLAEGKVIDGHAPGVTGNALSAYVTAGVTTDHECQTADEMWERLRLGQYVLMREGTAAKNVKALLTALTVQNMARVLLCTDDRDAHSLLSEGAVDYAVRLLMKEGVDPATAIRLATLNTAEAYGLKTKGAIAPGKEATFSILNDLASFDVADVYVLGEHVATAGKTIVPLNPARQVSGPLGGVTVKLPGAAAMRIRIASERARVIGMVPDSLETELLLEKVGEVGSVFVPDKTRSLLLNLERHGGSGNVGSGIIKGYGIENGAIAQSIGHDSHNVTVIGDNAADMRAAVSRLAVTGGGIVIVQNGEVAAEMTLEIAGLMTDQPLQDVEKQSAVLYEVARERLAIPATVDPFVALSFMSLPVIPALKLTTKGLFDVTAFQHVPLFA